MLAAVSLLVALPVAHAEEPAATEIIVYEDPFARWDDTRWEVQVELLTPLGTLLAVDENRGLTSYLYQVGAVVRCDKTARLGRRRYEVDCELEDVAIRATTYRHSGGPAAHEVADAVLDEIDAMLTGARLQLQVDAAGGVNDVDLEGLVARNERARFAHESLRQVMARLAGGFHLEIPDQAQREGTFIERNSAMMAMPSLTGSQGATELLHGVQPWNGHHLVQSRGHGMVSISVPAPPSGKQREVDQTEFAELPDVASPADDTVPSQFDLMAGGSGVQPSNQNTRDTLADTLLPNPASTRSSYRVQMPTADPPESLGTPLVAKNRSDGGLLDLQMTYELEASAVALFEPATGVMTERVWVVLGEPTAGSGGGSTPLPYRSIGRLRRLEDGESPDLGPSHQVSAPGRSVAGLEALQPLVRIED